MQWDDVWRMEVVKEGCVVQGRTSGDGDGQSGMGGADPSGGVEKP